MRSMRNLGRRVLPPASLEEEEEDELDMLPPGLQQTMIRLWGLCIYRIRIWTKKPLAIEMNDMVRIFGNPNLRFP